MAETFIHYWHDIYWSDHSLRCSMCEKTTSRIMEYAKQDRSVVIRACGDCLRWLDESDSIEQLIGFPYTRRQLVEHDSPEGRQLEKAVESLLRDARGPHNDESPNE